MALFIDFVKRHYRHVVILAFFLFVHPLLLKFASFEGDDFPPYVPFFLIALGTSGIFGTYLKLKELDPIILACQLEKKALLGCFRLIGGAVSLPIIPAIGLMGLLSILLGSPMSHTSDFEIILSYSLAAVPSSIIFWKYGLGKKRSVYARHKKIASVLLIVFELGLYTLFLETLNLANPHYAIARGQFFILLFAASALYFLLFLPALFAPFLELYLERKSIVEAVVISYLQFLFLRFLPIYWIYYFSMQFGW
jgi:hypothetical protein